ncbi:HlyD family secretion protein [Desulfurobacterium atlanticum]|uniref:HlyD family secretion protein n=1 Tax=Desulfurobacterium atlanticum TaxID=240169 RepID=A0A238Y5Q2_9BACT|nr:efflux RND transporter periplasmic adaptor subunit [Desulfurobacterium atlanticum]SNR66596.1 HlyD family secretion protein [Desulfurobacterium atlanticum]
MKKVVSILAVFLFLFSCQYFEKESKAIYVSGRIEGNEIDVGTKFPGRVRKVYVDEGDSVKKGQIIAVLEAKDVDAKLKQAKAGVKTAKTAALAKEKEIAVYVARVKALENRKTALEKEIDEQIKIAKKRKALAENDVSLARKAYDKAKAVFDKTKADFERFKTLYEKRIISRADFDKAKMAFEVAKADLESAKENLKKAETAVKIADAGIKIALTKRSEIDAINNEIQSFKAIVEAKRKEYQTFLEKVKQAEAVVEEVKANLEDMVIKSPIDGVVTVKYVNTGEVVPAGFRIVSVVNLNDVYLKGYIPEKKIGLIRIGQPAYIVVDAYPDKKFPAYVSYISQKAEFTPKEVQTKEERVKEVFAVKLKLKKNPDGISKPGMPADGYIELSK